MEWIAAAFWARIGWIAGEIAGWAMLAVVVMIIIAIFNMPSWLKRRRCRHLRFHETGACDAICLDCGQNLGFIQTQRERPEAKETRRYG